MTTQRPTPTVPLCASVPSTCAAHNRQNGADAVCMPRHLTPHASTCPSPHIHTFSRTFTHPMASQRTLSVLLSIAMLPAHPCHPTLPRHTLSPHFHAPRGVPAHVASAALDRQDSDAARTLATPLFSSSPAATAPASDTGPGAAPCLSTAAGPFRVACSRRCRLGLGCGKCGALGDGHQVSAEKVGNSGPGQLPWWVPLVEVPQPSSHAVLLQSVN